MKTPKIGPLGRQRPHPGQNSTPGVPDGNPNPFLTEQPTQTFYTQPATPAPGAPGAGPQQSLRTPEAVLALRELLGDDDNVHKIACTYPTWERFASSSHAELVHHLGNRIPRIPPTQPPTPALPPGVALMCRYQPTYPRGLRESATPPVLLYVTGTLPTTPALAVIGANNPSATGVEIARAAAAAAADQQIPLVVPLVTGCSLVAGKAALEAHGKIAVVLPHGLGTGSAHQRFLEDVLAAGGSVISPFSPQVQLRESTEDAAASVAALIAKAVVLAEVGTFASAGQAATSAAVTSGRYLIVPEPPAEPESGRYIPPSAYGTAIFSSPREWSSEYFGTSHRIQQRCENGLAPADSVVATPEELAYAVAVGCAPDTDRQAPQPGQPHRW